MDDMQRKYLKQAERKEEVALVGQLSGLAVGAIWGASALVLRLTHADMTETRLFLTFWWWWLLAIPAYFLVAFVILAVLRRRS